MKSERVELAIESVHLDVELERLEGAWFDDEYYYKECMKRVDSLLRSVTKCLQGELERTEKQVSTNDELITDNIKVKIGNITIKLICPLNLSDGAYFSLAIEAFEVRTTGEQPESAQFVRQSRHDVVNRLISISGLSVEYWEMGARVAQRVFACAGQATWEVAPYQPHLADRPVHLLSVCVQSAKMTLPLCVIKPLRCLLDYVNDYSGKQTSATAGRKRSLWRPRRRLQDTVHTEYHPSNLRRWFRYLVFASMPIGIL